MQAMTVDSFSEATTAATLGQQFTRAASMSA
jgi:hypothetical protein